MSDFLPLTYGDLSVLLGGYPTEAPILVDLLSEEDEDIEYGTAPNTVGQCLDHCRSMPQDGAPLIATERGPHLAVGVLFSVTSPITILVPWTRG